MFFDVDKFRNLFFSLQHISVLCSLGCEKIKIMTGHIFVLRSYFSTWINYLETYQFFPHSWTTCQCSINWAVRTFYFRVFSHGLIVCNAFLLILLELRCSTKITQKLSIKWADTLLIAIVGCWTNKDCSTWYLQFSIPELYHMSFMAVEETTRSHYSSTFLYLTHVNQFSGIESLTMCFLFLFSGMKFDKEVKAMTAWSLLRSSSTLLGVFMDWLVVVQWVGGLVGWLIG